MKSRIALIVLGLASFVSYLIGKAMRIMHWPGGTLLFYIGLTGILLALGFFIYSTVIKRR